MLIIASYGENGTPDAMNAAWGGVADSSRIAMYLSGGHKTVKNILKRGAFTVSTGDVEHLVACDYVGIVSGNSVPDKVARGLPHDEERACGRADDRRAAAHARVQVRELRRGD